MPERLRPLSPFLHYWWQYTNTHHLSRSGRLISRV
jgi:hypothetical protein